MRSRIARRASTLISALIATISIAVMIQLSLSLQDHEYLISEGMWPVVEQERSILLLREMVQMISLGQLVSEADYQLRRGIAFSRADIIRDFAQDNPTFDGAHQRDLLIQLQHNLNEYASIEQSKLPVPEIARRLLPSINAAADISHDLVNIRRDALFDANIQTFGLIRRLQISQIITLVLLILIGIGFYYRNQTANRRLRTTMLQAEDLAIANERTRMAREIHDGLGHHLDEIHMHLGAAWVLRDKEPGTAYNSLNTAREQMVEARKELRRAINALRADHLAAPLEELLGDPLRTCELAGVHTALYIHGTPRILPEQTKQVFYRITQEALTNVRKHARASQVEVWLDYRQPTSVRLIIQDNGVGGPPQNSGGRGLVGLRERVELVRGRIEIDSQSGRGYRIEVEVAG